MKSMGEAEVGKGNWERNGLDICHQEVRRGGSREVPLAGTFLSELFFFGRLENTRLKF